MLLPSKNPFSQEVLLSVYVDITGRAIDEVIHASMGRNRDLHESTAHLHSLTVTKVLKYIVVNMQENGVDLSPIQHLLEESGVNHVSD